MTRGKFYQNITKNTQRHASHFHDKKQFHHNITKYTQRRASHSHGEKKMFHQNIANRDVLHIPMTKSFTRI